MRRIARLTDKSRNSLIDNLTKEINRQNLMLRLSSNFVTGRQVDSVISDSLRMAGGFLGVTRMIIAVPDHAAGECVVKYVWTGSERLAPAESNRDLYNIVTGTFPNEPPEGEWPTIYCDDTRSRENPLFAILAGVGAKSFIWAPIYIEHGFWGILSVEENERYRSWAAGDRELVGLMSSIIAGAAERAVRELELSRMAGILERSPLFVARATNGRIAFVNPAFAEFFGKEPKEIENDAIEKYLEPEQCEKILRDYRESAHREGACYFDLAMSDLEGKRRHFSAMIYVTDEGITFLAQEDTDKFIAEKEKEEALEAARAASRAKTDFLSNMSHEMRTPLNAVIGMTTIARSTQNAERKDYCLNKIEQAGTHLLGVINDILDMSKIEANKFELSPVDFDFEKAAQNVVNVIQFKTEEKRQLFNVHIDQDIPQYLFGDSLRLAQVLTNLLGNAVKFTPEGGEIKLFAEMVEETEADCELRLEVKDSGMGMNGEQLGKLFNSFTQADSSIARKFGGTGLGLAISKRIVEMMGGAFTVNSEVDKGSSFIFTVRMKKAVQPEAELYAPTSPQWVDPSSVKALMVDDDADTRVYFLEIAAHLGFECDTAESGEAALKLLDCGNVYNLYFVDWNMPGMNGCELAKEIKAREAKRPKGGKEDYDPVVIMISAVEWTHIEHEAKAAGIDGFLPKPLFKSGVWAAISDIFSTGEQERTASGYTDDFGGKTILLAEDVEINREIVQTILEPAGLNIIFAEDGAEAVDKYFDNPGIDIVLMDIQMPNMDGMEATRLIRGREGGRRVPIIAMTANVFKEDVDKCKECGMDDHLGKPLDFEDVFAKLRKYLS